ncbi:MAG: PKD domain-containing protein, partial [Bacteroidota bacterium]
LGGTFSQGEQSFLYTPCFDFSSLIKPKVSFNLWYDVEVVGTQFEVSANHGSSWAVFGASADPQWYNQGYNWIGHSGEWVEMSHELHSFAGYPEVQFRYKFTGTVLFDGIGLDDFSICDEPAGGFDVSVNGLEVSFTDTSINADSWYWDFGDTTYSSDQNPVHIYTSNGTYTVMLIAGNTCNADTVYSTFYVTSVKDFPFSRLEIFPNPADRMLYIRSDIRDLHVTFSTVEGIVIYKFPVSEDAEIDISHFAPGVYIASFYTGNWSTVRKIIVR